MANRTFAEQYVPGIPQVQQQTYGQGYGDWQQYAKPKQGIAPPQKEQPLVVPPVEDFNYSLNKIIA